MRRWLLVVMVPLGVLVSTGIACALLAASEREDSQQRRQAAAQLASSGVGERLDTTISRLSTTTGLFAASAAVTEAEFRQFTQTLLVEPTIDNMVYVARVPAANAPRSSAASACRSWMGAATPRRAPRPGASTSPRDGGQAPREAPREHPGRRLRAGARGGTAARPRHRDAQTTAPVKTFRKKIPALLVFVPLYRDALPPATLAERRRTLRGYAVGILPLAV